MKLKVRAIRAICVAAATACVLNAGNGQNAPESNSVTVRMTTLSKAGKAETHPTPAVVWLKPLGGRTLPPFAHGPYVLLQKNRKFTPHVLVVPAGSVVLFPNEDPFFHNVFSLFNGKRFDLGLYEAGKTKEVTFSREGLSYIFCNIHPEMSAVVIALTTPLYAEGDAPGTMVMREVPAGEYELHVWVEGQSQTALDRIARRIRVGGGAGSDAIDIALSIASESQAPHTNKFGQPYEHDPDPIY